MYVFNKRSVTMCIVLTIVTCGLYGIYWLYAMANEINALEDNYVAPSGASVVLLSIVTCGLYHIYYIFMASKRLFYLFDSNGIQCSDNALINVLLCIACYFVPGAYIVAYAIMQNDINRLVDDRLHARKY